MEQQSQSNGTIVSISSSQRLAKPFDRVSRSNHRQHPHHDLDQPLRSTHDPNQWFLLAFRLVPCNRYKLSQVDGYAKVFGIGGVVYLDTNLFQLW